MNDDYEVFRGNFSKLFMGQGSEEMRDSGLLLWAGEYTAVCLRARWVKHFRLSHATKYRCAGRARGVSSIDNIPSALWAKLLFPLWMGESNSHDARSL